MKIRISELYMTIEQSKSRYGIPCIVCSRAYDHKDALKALGYNFNDLQKTWEKVIDPQHFIDLCAETAIACKLSVKELEDMLCEMSMFLETVKGQACCNDFTVDGLGDRYNAYCDSIGY